MFPKRSAAADQPLHFRGATATSTRPAPYTLVGDNFSLIRSGFPLQKFRDRSADTAAWKAKYGLPTGSFVCGIIAPFKPQKGLFHLLDIAARVISRNPAVIFFIAGDGEQRRELEAELHAARHRGRISACPDSSPTWKTPWIASHIGVSTALWEGLPQSLVQLRLKKKAVVASDIPGNREVIRDGLNGFLVPVTDHERFASAILKLAADPVLRERFGNYAGEDFSDWEAAEMVARQEELYRCLLARRMGG